MQAASGAANDAAAACSNAILSQSSVCNQLTKPTCPKLRMIQLRHSLLSIPKNLRIQGLLDISCGRSGLSTAVGQKAGQQHPLLARCGGSVLAIQQELWQHHLQHRYYQQNLLQHAFGMLALFFCHERRGTASQ